jgi:hypothetical protein
VSSKNKGKRCANIQAPFWPKIIFCVCVLESLFPKKERKKML